jgi:DNA-binding response OmpR family regulator
MDAPAAAAPLLLIEDDDDVAFVVDYLLTREGLAIERASDGCTAMNRIRAGPPPPLVVLDLMLPYHDGFELLATLRATPGWATVPVLVLTSKTLENDAVRVFAGGADDLVVKPFHARELVARIQRLLARSAA